MTKHYLGIEIGGSKLQVVVAGEDLKPFQAFRLPIDRTAGASGIKASIKACLANLDEKTFTRIGIGFGGPVNKVTGEIFASYHIEGWRGFAIKTWLQDLTSCEVIVDNDANVAALAEALQGAGTNQSRVLYITLGSGVGAGFVVDKKIYHGTEPGEMEFGHIRLDRSGATIQDRCSGWAVNEKIKTLLSRDPQTILHELVKDFPGHEAKALGKALATNDASASRLLSETMNDFSFGLSHAIHLLHPDVVILGGGLSLLGEVLVREVQNHLPGYLMDAFQPGPPLRLSALQESAVPIGALALAIHQPEHL